jgi:hypothetical protein
MPPYACPWAPSWLLLGVREGRRAGTLQLTASPDAGSPVAVVFLTGDLGPLRLLMLLAP